MAKVEFPDEEKMQQFAQLVCACEPSVQDIIGFMDGCHSNQKAQVKRFNKMHSTAGMIVIPW